MRKALLLTSLASLAAVSFGCALTDYPAMGVHNKSHGVVGCTTDDRMANTQQTLETGTRDLLYTTTFGGPSLGGNCTTGFNPGVSLNTVNHEDARDWNRFIADYMFFGEAQVFSPVGFDGTYILAGAKDLADGSVRLNNYERRAVGAFSCVGQAVDGRYGGPEGVIVNDSLERLPGLHVGAIAIDSVPGSEFCPNIVAVHPDRAAAGFSTYWSFLVRGGEGRVAFTPVTRREGLANFLSGGSMTVTVEGVTVTAKGQLEADGTMTMALQSLSANGVSYEAETPILIGANPGNDFKTWTVRPTSSELVRLAQFALDANLTDVQFDLQGKQILELGVSLPPASFMVSGETLENFIASQVDGSGDGAPGFGG